jgi:hypothetical protein
MTLEILVFENGFVQWVREMLLKTKDGRCNSWIITLDEELPRRVRETQENSALLHYRNAPSFNDKLIDCRGTRLFKIHAEGFQLKNAPFVHENIILDITKAERCLYIMYRQMLQRDHIHRPLSNLRYCTEKK